MRIFITLPHCGYINQPLIKRIYDQVIVQIHKGTPSIPVLQRTCPCYENNLAFSNNQNKMKAVINKDQHCKIVNYAQNYDHRNVRCKRVKRRPRG